MSQTRHEKLKQLFKMHPTATQFSVAQDETVFHHDNDAQNYANSQKHQAKPVIVTRAQHEAAEAALQATGSPSGDRGSEGLNNKTVIGNGTNTDETESTEDEAKAKANGKKSGK